MTTLRQPSSRASNARYASRMSLSVYRFEIRQLVSMNPCSMRESGSSSPVASTPPVFEDEILTVHAGQRQRLIVLVHSGNHHHGVGPRDAP